MENIFVKKIATSWLLELSNLLRGNFATNVFLKLYTGRKPSDGLVKNWFLLGPRNEAFGTRTYSLLMQSIAIPCPSSFISTKK